jgi:sialate O-acetylesterase
MNKGKRTQSLILLMALLSIFTFATCNIEYRTSNNSYVKNLDGQWKFSLGDDMEWMNPDFNDSSWDMTNVPSAWENDGYVGYDGYAWYRTKLIIPSHLFDEALFLDLGQIDDVDETYLNGHKIGGLGSFPPNYESAYNKNRHYYIPKEYLIKDGYNVLAVRVYDEKQDGGIINGQVGIYTYRNMPEMLVSMEGSWKFKKDDNADWSSPKLDDWNWESINVPNTWESQGYFGYDGYAWYRHQFSMPSVKEDDMVLMLGNIDDNDQVFVNGTMIGSTGDFDEHFWSKNSDNWDKSYSELRGYEIPKGLLKAGSKNLIAVRVFDHHGEGGIYNGPVGILSYKEYKKYKSTYEEYSNSSFYLLTKRVVINTFNN